MKKERKISTVIVTYNGMKWINKCLDSLFFSDEKNEVIIVDNNSNDKTTEFIQNNYPDVILLKENKNLGFGQANNLGISYALKNGADYVFLLNQDAYIKKDTIQKLAEVSQENSDYGVLSPMHLNGNETALDFKFSNYMLKNKEVLLDSVLGHFSKKTYDVPFVNAAAWFLPRKTFDIVGGFDPLFFHYGEDDNYCQRVIFHNLKIGIVPNTFALHDREFREKKILLSISEKLSLKERRCKKKWADINVDKINVLADKEKKNINKKILRFSLKCDFQKTLFHVKELNLINRIQESIFRSREINRTKGNHYLNY